MMGCMSAKPWTSVATAEPQLDEVLSRRQLDLVKTTWPAMSDAAEEIGVTMFARLFQTDKDLKALFVGLTQPSQRYEDGELSVDDHLLRMHSQVVMEVLGAAVECLDDSSTLSPVLVALGQMHVPYGVRTHYLPRFWPAVRYALEKSLRDLFDSETEEAWRIVFNFIIGKMSVGIRTDEHSKVAS